MSDTLGSMSSNISSPLIGAAQAAELVGISLPTWRRLVAAYPDLLSPVDSLAAGHLWRLSDVLTYLDTQDRAERARREELLNHWGVAPSQR